MANTVTLKMVRAESIKFCNQVEGQVQIHFENKFSYNVKYAANGNICRGEFHVQAYDRDLGEKFSCEVTVIGIFEYTSGTGKDAIHRATFKELFPHARALVTTVSSVAGIPPIIIPAIDIDAQDIYSIDMNGMKS